MPTQIMPAQALLTSFLSEPESETLDFTASPEPEAVARVVTSLLNTRGGIVVSGASLNREKLETFLLSHIVPKAALRIEAITQGGQEKLVIEAPPGSQKPYVFDGTIYVRRGAHTTPASPADVTRLIHHRTQEDERWERRVVVGVEPECLSLSELDQTVEAAARRYVLPVESNATALMQLERLELAADGWPRNAAIVLFLGEDHYRRYPQLAAHATVFKDDHSREMMDDAMWQGSAFSLFQSLFHFVGRHISVRSSMEPGSLVRQDRPALPALVMREAILNALTHREYDDPASIQLRLFPDRLELWNPGDIPEELIQEPGVSRPRNPDIARVLYLRGFVEMLGLGMLRMREEMLAVGLPAPQWENRSGGTLLTLYLATDGKDKTGDTADVELRLLSERALAYLKDAVPGERMTREEYHTRYGAEVAERSARTDLKRLTQLGFIRQVGAGYKTAYMRTAKARPLEL